MAIPVAIASFIGARKNQKKLDKLIKNAPKYKITDEAFENQAIARSEAYGRDRSIQMQEQKLEQDAENAVSSVKDVTSGTSGLLSTIAAIQANKDSTRRDLATSEAQLQAQKKSQLLNVNSAMIDEKDKAWNYNENMPYQMKVAALRDKVKFKRELGAQSLAASANFWSSFVGKGGGGGGNSQIASGGEGGRMPTMEENMYSSNSRYS